MPDSGIADGAVLTSAFWDDYVREQVVTTCTSITRPTAVEGRLIYETDTDRIMFYNGASWLYLSEPVQTPTVVVKQNGNTVTSTTTVADYSRHRDMVDAFFDVAITAAGTVATELKLTPTGLPAPGTNRGLCVGVFSYFDSGSTNYHGYVDWDGTDLHFVCHNNGNYLGATPSFAAANGDSIRCSLRYRT